MATASSRLLAGLSSGAVFSAGTAWLREMCRGAPGISDHTIARGSAIAMTAGFALGPLTAGLLAQWAPAPTVVPYLPHIVLMTVVLLLLRNATETVSGPAPSPVRASRPGLRRRPPQSPSRCCRASWAPIRRPMASLLTAAITMLCALAGVLVQPLARRLDGHAQSNRAATTGLLVLTAGLALSAVTAHDRQPWLLVPCAIVLGSAHGLCLVAGLVEIQRLAGQRELGGLTAVYYALTYLGFAVPYLFAQAARLASYPALLVIGAVIALATAAQVAHRSRAG